VTAPPSGVTLAPLGDRALLLEITGDAEECNQRVAAIARLLLEHMRRGSPILDVAPAMHSLAVFFDPNAVARDTIERELIVAAASVPASPERTAPAHRHVVPVIYTGPDLADAAARLGLTPAELVRRHTGKVYRVRFLGFAPGFAYLGPLDPALVLPRRAEPRPRVLAGSVAIAGDQTAVYPLDTPGGWHLIGHTAVRPFDPERSPPSLFAAGEEVRFEAVEA
jgi:5-oxoprolinase (ATP-hydrolysing) subunit B